MFTLKQGAGCGKVKRKSQAASYELRYVSCEFRFTVYELNFMSLEFKSKSYSSNLRVTSLKAWVMSSNPRFINSDMRVTGSKAQARKNRSTMYEIKLNSKHTN